MLRGMVQYVLRLLLILATALACLCGIVMAAPPHQARPTFTDYEAFGFGQCSLPCYAGLKPGSTPFDQASSLILANVPKIDMRMYISGSALNFWSYGVDTRLSGLISYRNGMVGNIQLSGHLPFRWLIDQLGTPTCVMTTPSSDPSALNYLLWYRGGAVIGAATTADSSIAKIEGGIIQLWVSNADETNCTDSSAIRWLGFAPTWRYRQLEYDRNQ